MKPKGRILVGLGLIVTLSASLAVAQSLGDLARQEKAKRSKQTKKPAKVYTNENMPARPPGEGPAAAAYMSTEAPPATVPIPGAPEVKSDDKQDKQGSKELWQGRFKAAKQQIAAAEDSQHLSEDELSLLQIQQARELDPDTLKELDVKVKDKTADVEAKRAQTDKTKKALEALEKQFKESGAPADWGKTD